MRVNHRRPAPPLDAAIDRYWSWCLGEDGVPAAMLPSMPGPGGMEVFFHLGQPFSGDDGALLPRSHLLCVRSAPLPLVMPVSMHFIAVRVKAGAIPRLTDIPVASLVDTCLAANALWGRAADELEEQLALANNMNARTTLLDRFFISRLREPVTGRDLHPAVASLLGGQLRIDRVAEATGLGRRQFENRFRHATGSSPVRFRRVARLRRALRSLLLAPEGMSSSLLDEGYVDQAQQIHEFRELTGCTPMQLRRTVKEGAAHFYNASWMD